MPPALPDKEWRFAVVAFLLLASIPAFLLIPFAQPWGLDFHNLYAFHHCAARSNPYLATGTACGDVGGRDMVYPPLLYWSFVWVRLLSYLPAFGIWAAVIGIGLAGSLAAWLPPDEWTTPVGSRVGAFLGLLLAQFPVLFAIERGNNDVLVLMVWTVSVRLYSSRRIGAAGLLAGISAALKIYPSIACLVVGLGLAIRSLRHPPARRDLLRFAGGGTLGVVLAGAAFWGQTRLYLGNQLPRFASSPAPLVVFGHPLHSIVSAPGSWWLGLALLTVWIAAAARLLGRAPIGAFAGALAISTYFSGTSYDYNLFTTYPLLLLLFVRMLRRPGSVLTFATLLLGLLSVTGSRFLFAGSAYAMKAHVALQWAWLVATATVVGQHASEAFEAHSPSPA